MTELRDPSIQSIKELVRKKKPFAIHATEGNLLEYSSRIEAIIESENMSCRIRTKNRTIVNAGLFFTGIGFAGFAAQWGHNLSTFNPDWEIVRNPLNNKINVDYRPGASLGKWMKKLGLGRGKIPQR